MSNIVGKISTLRIRQQIISLWIVIGEVRIKLVEILLKLSFKINKSEEENQIHIDILWEKLVLIIISLNIQEEKARFIMIASRDLMAFLLNIEKWTKYKKINKKVKAFTFILKKVDCSNLICLIRPLEN